MDILPCGCKMWTDVIDGVNTFMYEPCKLDCTYYKFVLEETEKQGKPAVIIDTR